MLDNEPTGEGRSRDQSFAETDTTTNDHVPGRPKAGEVTREESQSSGSSSENGSSADKSSQGAPARPAAAVMFVAPPPPTATGRPAGSQPRRTKQQSAPSEATEQSASKDESSSTQAGNDLDDGERRRRRRGRRGRGGRGRTTENGPTDSTATETAETDNSAETSTTPPVTTTEPIEAAENDSAGATRRRRRRQRSTGESTGDTPRTDDPPNTVVHVREPQPVRETRSDNEVQTVRGSTRLEARRQRRRDGRDHGRRRAPILTEAEFLARREAVDRLMVVRQRGDRTQIAVLEDGVLVEHYVSKASTTSYAGNVYLGRVQNVLPSMEAAFVDIGKGRNAVLYAGEVNWDALGLEGKPRQIQQVLKSGDPVVVQVTKDPIGHKGARLTSQISIPGRFLVYVPGGSMTGISRKLPDTERQRLKDVLRRVLPENAGVIVRTAAEGASDEELAHDVARLQAQWEVIQKKSETAKSSAPTLLYEEPDLAIRVVRDIFNEDFSRLVVSGDDAADTLEQYIAHVAPDLAPRLSKHVGESDVFADYRVDEQLAKGLDRKVWLPSGGSLVIDRTEAMTVIDVNTGKFVGSESTGGSLEETVTRNNLEAAEEIVRQLRLRDVGGIIVIDFIDMVLESNRELVLRRLTECLGRDRTRHQVAEVTSLGLVQMTRKRVGQGLLEAFSNPCEHCNGRGVILRSEPVDEGTRRRPVPVEPPKRQKVKPPAGEPSLPPDEVKEAAAQRAGVPDEALDTPLADATENAAGETAPAAAGTDQVSSSPKTSGRVPDRRSMRRRRRTASRPAGPPSPDGQNGSAQKEAG